MAGTEGEKRAQEFIENELEKLNIEYKKEFFQYTEFYMNVLLRIYDSINGFLIIAILFLMYYQLYSIAFLISIILFMLSIFSREIREWLHFKCNNLGVKKKSSNYIINFHKNPNNQNLVVFAHYDSISHSLNPIISGILYFFSLVIGTCYAIYIMLICTFIISFTHLVLPFDLNWFLWGLFLLPVFFLQIFNKRHNKSKGTIDNATGVANSFYLMDYFKENPLKNTNITFVLTGAEELGDQGANSFIQNYWDKLLKNKTYFFIIDSVGGNKDKNLYFYAQGVPKKRFSPVIEENIKEILEKQPGKYSLNSMYIPPLIHYSTDHTPLKPYGYEFMIFSSNGAIHSKKDNLSNYYPGKLEDFNLFSKELIKQMDENFIKHKENI